MLDYEKILAEAIAAAKGAVEIASHKYPEMAGACGFAWIKIDGTDGLARHCRKQIKIIEAQHLGNQETHRRTHLYGSKGYPNGWQFWNPGNHIGQRVDIKEAGAIAFRDVLANYGIRADVGSRLD